MSLSVLKLRLPVSTYLSSFLVKSASGAAGALVVYHKGPFSCKPYFSKYSHFCALSAKQAKGRRDPGGLLSI